jgi:hypothetical protein
MSLLSLVVELDGGRPLAEAEAHPQAVRVGAAALPQPAARTEGGEQDGGRVRLEQPARVALSEHRRLGARLRVLLLLLPLRVLLAVLPAPGLAVHDEVRQRHHRRHHREDQEVVAVEEDRHRRGHERRGDHHDPRELALLRLARLLRDRELGLALRRQQPGRAVEVDARVVGREADVTVRQRERRALEDRLAGREVRALGPVGLALDRHAVQRDLEARRRRHVHRALDRAGDPQPVRRHADVRQRQPGRAAADERVAQRQPVHAAGAGAVDDAQLRDAGGAVRRRRRGRVHGEDAAGAQADVAERGVHRRDRDAVTQTGTCARNDGCIGSPSAPTTGPRTSDSRRRVRVEQEVDVATALPPVTRCDTEPHRPSPDRLRVPTGDRIPPSSRASGYGRG